MKIIIIVHITNYIICCVFPFRGRMIQALLCYQGNKRGTHNSCALRPSMHDWSREKSKFGFDL